MASEAAGGNLITRVWVHVNVLNYKGWMRVRMRD